MRQMGITLAKQISTLAHTHNKTAILMLGGENSDATLSQAWRTNPSGFITNLVNNMTYLGYDGINIDWESDSNAVDYGRVALFAKATQGSSPC